MQIQVLGVIVDGWAALNLAVQFLLPLLVGLVTTKVTDRARQFLLLAFLTLVSTVGLQVLQDHQAAVQINLVQIVVQAVANFAVSLLSHYGVWKPTNLADLVQAIFIKAPTPGAHSAAPAPVDPAPVDPAPAAVSVPLPAYNVVPAPVAPAAAPDPSPAPLQPPLDAATAPAVPTFDRMAG